MTRLENEIKSKKGKGREERKCENRRRDWFPADLNESESMRVISQLAPVRFQTALIRALLADKRRAVLDPEGQPEGQLSI